MVKFIITSTLAAILALVITAEPNLVRVRRSVVTDQDMDSVSDKIRFGPNGQEICAVEDGENWYWTESDGFMICADSDTTNELNETVDDIIDEETEEDGELVLQGRRGGGDGGMTRQLGKKYNRWKIVTKMIAHIVADKTKGWSKKAIVKKMLNYGCHCFPGQKRARSVGGKGPAMDELDGLCRSQYQCHKCVQMEYGCDPDKVSYKAKFVGGKKKKPQPKSIECKDAKDTCSRQMCECDVHMAKVLKEKWSDEIHNRVYWREKKNMKKGGVFDYDSECETGISDPADQCCGDFPEVVPYSSSTKDCCAMKLFNVSTHQCCASSIVTLTGGC